MEYMTVAETAAGWGVSPRRVHRYLQDGRVNGAVRFGAAWMIPVDAEKPCDPRREKGQISLSSDLTDLFAATTALMPRHKPDAILDSVSEERLRLHYEDELAYLRGDFERLAVCFRKIDSEDVASRLRACPLTIAAAVNLGDCSLYQELETWLKAILKANLGAEVTAVAELSLDTAYTGAAVPHLVSARLKDGDFSALPPHARLNAAYKRAKYFQSVKKYESMLSVAQTALALCESEQGISLTDIYLRVARALACCHLNHADEAKKYLLDAVKICLPHGFITPFVEPASEFGGLLWECLAPEFPAYYGDITKRWRRTAENWVALHNKLAGDDIPITMSLRDTQMFVLSARGVPYREIAKQFNLTVGRVNNIMQEIHEKLNISGKKEHSQIYLYNKNK